MTCLSIYTTSTECIHGVLLRYTGRPEDYVVCRHQFVRPRGTVFPHGSFKNSFQTTIGYLNLPTCLWVIRGGETMSDSVFKHDLCKLVIAKMGSAITYDCTRGTKSRQKRVLRNFGTSRAIIGGEAFAFNQSLICNRLPRGRSGRDDRGKIFWLLFVSGSQYQILGAKGSTALILP
ncbi:hypothetical protein Tco_0469384 [Tanacetum coccineum]